MLVVPVAGLQLRYGSPVPSSWRCTRRYGILAHLVQAAGEYELTNAVGNYNTGKVNTLFEDTHGPENG